jgi:hypothetical protein
MLPAADPAAAWATPGGVASAPTATQPLFAASALRAGGRLRRPGQVLLAAIATILIAAVYSAYRMNAPTPEATEVASQPGEALERDAPGATAAMSVAVESKPVEPEGSVALQAPVSSGGTENIATSQPPVADTEPDAAERESADQRPPPVAATPLATAHERPVSGRQASVGASPRARQSHAAARGGTRVAKARKARRPDRWHVMEVRLANCAGGPLARFVCDQRVRLHFCEGHWGKVPQCASGVVNDHGQ